ncbi:MAG: glycosyltransferase family 4 protein [Terriglobales bacterium]
MKILLLTPKLNGRDGISLVSRTALAALKQTGTENRIEVRTLAPENFLPEQVSEACVCRSASGSKLRYLAWSTEDLLGGGRFDLVIAMHIHLAPAALAGPFAGSRLAVFLHGIEVWKPLTPLQHLAVRRASCVLANSQYTADLFRKRNPWYENCHVRVCPLGLPAVQGGGEVCDERYALIVGRMVKQEQYKGHDRLIELWPKLLEHAPGFRLLIAGDGEDRPRLEAKAKDRGVQDEVKFLGLVDDSTLLELYQNCSFFVMPSTGEGFGLVFLEAMRAAKPCIAAIGAASEVVEHGVCGFIVDPKVSETLLDAMLQLIRDPERARRMGCAGHERFMRMFTAEAFAARFTQALDLCSVPENSLCAG